jgi:hypothetical protein
MRLSIEPLEERVLLAASPVVDLVGTSLAAGPGLIAAGGLMKVTRSYQVAGATSPICYIQYHFSTNRIWGDSDDIVSNSKELLSTSESRSLGMHSGAMSLAVPLAAKASSYYLMAKVDGSSMVAESNERNNVIMSLVSVSPPSNDAFAKRAALAGTSATSYGINVNATFETGEPYHGGLVGGKSVWWTWTAADSGRATMDTVGSSFNRMAAFTMG